MPSSRAWATSSATASSSAPTVTDLRLCGGGANSAFWCRLLANVTGVPTIRSVDAEIGAKGAFLSAKVALGHEASMHHAVAGFVHARDTFEPDDAEHRRYDDLYAAFLDTVPPLSGEWPRLARLRDALAPCAADDEEEVPEPWEP